MRVIFIVMLKCESTKADRANDSFDPLTLKGALNLFSIRHLREPFIWIFQKGKNRRWTRAVLSALEKSQSLGVSLYDKSSSGKTDLIETREKQTTVIWPNSRILFSLHNRWIGQQLRSTFDFDQPKEFAYRKISFGFFEDRASKFSSKQTFIR